MITKPRRRWTDDNIERELRAQTTALGHFPTRGELVDRGLRGLWNAIRAAGGAEAWERRLDEHDHGVSHDVIAARAYELYECGAPGDSVEHWLAAERELGSLAA